MRFQLFKMFESRTSELTEEEFRKILHTKCKDFVKSPKLLQRSKTSEGSEFSYINPKSFDRAPLKKSDRFTDGVESRHHTLLMDNLPSWKDFPKRSQSVIGLTSEDSKVIFGFHRYLIIPFDNAKFGVAPSADLWGCQLKDDLIKTPSEWDGVWTPSRRISFNDRFSNMMINSEISDTSYQEMISDLQKLYDKYLKSGKLLFESFDFSKTPNGLEVLFFTIKENNFKNIQDGLSFLFKPEYFNGTDIDEQNGFQVMNWKYLSSLGNYETYEFWTDSECLLWYIGKALPFFDIEEAYQSFISDFIH